MKVVTLEVPELGNRCHLVHDGTRPSSSTLRGTWPPSSARPRPRASRSGRSPTPTCTTTTSREHSAWPGATAPTTCSRPTSGSTSSGSASATVMSCRSAGLRVRVVATPGHTRHHQSFLAAHRRRARRPLQRREPAARDRGPHRPRGRPPHPRAARAQWASARILGGLDPATRLHPDARVRELLRRARRPAAPDGGVTIGDQRDVNPALLLDREQFVSQLVAGLGPIPTYYRHMAPRTAPVPAGRSARTARPVTSEDVTDADPARQPGSSTSATGVVRLGTPAGHGQRGVRHPVRDVRRLAGALAGRHRAADRLPRPTSSPPSATSPRSASRGRHPPARRRGPADRVLPPRRLGRLPGRLGAAGRRRRPPGRRVRSRPPARRRCTSRSRTSSPGGVTLPAGELWVHCRSGSGPASPPASCTARPQRRPPRRRLGAGRRAGHPDHAGPRGLSTPGGTTSVGMDLPVRRPHPRGGPDACARDRALHHPQPCP